jgi:hypothetical protein
MDKPTVSPPEIFCNERRHLTPSQYMVYNAMRAIAESGKHKRPRKDGLLVCSAKETTIANHTSIGRSQIRVNIKALVEKGWLEPLRDIETDRQRRWRKGIWASNQYVIIVHDEYERRAQRRQRPYEFCPAARYVYDTGAPVEKATPEQLEAVERMRAAIRSTFSGERQADARTAPGSVPDNEGNCKQPRLNRSSTAAKE